MSEIICHCFEVSREEIENAIREKGQMEGIFRE